MRPQTAAWAAPVVSVVVVVAFAAMTWTVATRALPAGSEQVALVMLGTLASLATSVVTYWLGSSAGSARKTDLLAQSVPPAGGT